MGTGRFRIDEIQDAVDRYLHVREDIDAGTERWEALADLFTDDVVYVDPAWGRIEGRAALREFLGTSMRGLEDWSFPVETTAIAGDRVLVRWIQRLPVRRPDGSPSEQTGMSTLVYAGRGSFNYCEDVLNMVQVRAELLAGGWTPGPDFVMPPAHPDWGTGLPPRSVRA